MHRYRQNFLNVFKILYYRNLSLQKRIKKGWWIHEGFKKDSWRRKTGRWTYMKIALFCNIYKTFCANKFKRVATAVRIGSTDPLYVLSALIKYSFSENRWWVLGKDKFYLKTIWAIISHYKINSIFQNSLPGASSKNNILTLNALIPQELQNGQLKILKNLDDRHYRR